MCCGFVRTPHRPCPRGRAPGLRVLAACAGPLGGGAGALRPAEMACNVGRHSPSLEIKLGE
eukprot:15031833-Heterocapsa_arctica.AAC.1